MTFATVSPQGALRRPCSPSSPTNRSRRPHFHVSTQQQQSTITPTSIISFLPQSVTLQSIPRSNSGGQQFQQFPPPSAIILQSKYPSQPLLISLPNTARSRIREHQSAELQQQSAAKNQIPSSSARRVSYPDKMASVISSSTKVDYQSTLIVSPASTPHHHYHIPPERTSPSPYASATRDHYLQTPTKIRVVTKPIEAIMVDGDNPFRPEGELFKEAEVEIKELLRSQSTSPLPKQEIEEIHIPKEVLDAEFPMLIGVDRDSKVSNGGPNSTTSEPSRTSVVSQGSTSPSTKKSEVERESPQTEREESGREPTSARTDAEKKEIETVVDNGTSREKKKKKKRQVGCGGDQKCSIM